MADHDTLRKQAIQQALDNAAQRMGSEEFRKLLQKRYQIALAINEHLVLQAQRKELLKWIRK